jgi:DNA-binding PadR family transcriptional regulator
MARAPGREAADAQLLVLISLAPGPKHGHAILLDVEAFSGHRMGPGTLYGAIERLESAGLIVPEKPVGRRLPYRLTDAGREFLARRLATIEGLSRVGRQRVAR